MYIHAHVIDVHYVIDVYMIYTLIAQSVRAFEQNSVVVGSNLTQANFLELFQIILQWR